MGKLQLSVFAHTHQLFIKYQTPKENFTTPLEPNSYKELPCPMSHGSEPWSPQKGRAHVKYTFMLGFSPSGFPLLPTEVME